MLRVLFFLVIPFLSMTYVYGQNDTIPSSPSLEEDSIVYIQEAPLIIKKTVSVNRLEERNMNWEIFLIGHLASSLFNDAYATTSSGNDTYTNTVKSTLYGNYSFRWGAELVFIFKNKKSFGVEYDFGKMNQSFNYTLPNGISKSCNTYMDHSYVLLKIGRVIPLFRKVSFHPKIGLGAAILYQQEGLVPSLANSYYDDRYADYIKTKKITPMAALELSVLYHFKKRIVVGFSPFINGNFLSYTTSGTPYNVYRQNYGVRLLLGLKLK